MFSIKKCCSFERFVYLLFLFLCITVNKSYAQLDTSFWFAAPEVSQSGNENLDRPIVLRISTLNQPAIITVSMPANNSFTPITVNVPANNTQSIDLTQWIDLIESKPPNTVLNNGIKVFSTAPVNIYYEVVSGLNASCQCNPEIFVFKGKNSLGQKFIIPSQNLLNNGPYSPPTYSSFDIIATEDNTTITITPKPGVIGHSGGIPFQIILNKGQVFSCAAVSNLAIDHLAGSTVISDKPIAITVKDDLLSSNICSDLAGDQIIPIDNLSTEYIAIEGFLTSGLTDRVFITAVNDNTNVYVGGNLYATINASQTINIPFTTQAMYITSSDKIYAFQLSGFGCEVGMSSIPSSSCRGSTNVSFTRSSVTSLFLLIATKAGNQNYFQLNGTPLDPTTFNVVPGTSSQWVFARISIPLSQIPAFSSGRLVNTKGLFHLGIIHGDISGGARFGYFSDFSKPSIDVLQDSLNVCGDSILLDPGPGFTNYLWNTGSNTQSIMIHQNGQYKVIVTNNNGCILSDSSYVNLEKVTFDSNRVSICSGQSYILPWGISINNPGVYKDTLRYKNGCDSVIKKIIVTLSTTVFDSSIIRICNGKSYILPWGQIVNATGIYKDTLRNIAGCDSMIRTINLTVQNTSSITTNASICAGASFTLPWGSVATSPGTYRDTIHSLNGCDSIIQVVNLGLNSPQLLNANFKICPNQNFILPWGSIVNSPGIYRDTLHYSNGCDSVIQTVQLSANTTNTITSSASICSGQNYTLPWGPVVSSTGTYRDTLHYAVGCDSIIRVVNLTVRASNTSSNNINICSGLSYSLPWGAVVNTTGVYKDTLRYANGCDSLIRIVNLTITSSALHFTKDTSICQGSVYTLPWGSSVTTAGTYRDTLKAFSGCDSVIRSITVNFNSNPLISLSKSNDINCTLGTTKLKATGGSKYQWFPVGTLNNSNIPNPIASPTSTTTYHVFVTNNGCVSEDSIKVTVSSNPTRYGFLMPDAFTPNGDGKNDCFGVRSWGAITDLKFYVYNRWGQLIFFTTDPEKCWDGTYRGIKVPIGVFIYQVFANTMCGKIYRKGTVTVIR